MTARLKISMIAAMAENHVIGSDNKLPWYIPEDLQHFKQKTIHKSILMGRKTYESLGKPLPSRHNIILTNNKKFHAPCDIAYDMEQAKHLATSKGSSELVIIGGAQIYQLTIDLVSSLYLTYVHQEVTGDAYFPKVALDDWQLISQQKFTSRTDIDYSILTYQR